MNLQELRIGNYYKWTSEGKEYYFKIEPRDFTNNNYKNFEPIELTEDILLKCGFNVSKYSDTLFILELTEWSSIQVHLYKNKCATELSISKHSQVVEVYFLHQLQNLYFALTNEELIINL